MLQTLSENLGYLAAIATAVGTLAAFKPGRRALLWLFRPFWMPWLMLKELKAELKALGAVVNELKTEVVVIKKEVTPNGGGSMNDAVRRIEFGVARTESHREHWFWVQPRPAMEMDHKGKVIRVSAACCQLFKVDRPEDLTAVSWMGMLDPKRVSEFRAALVSTMEYDSKFDFSILLHDRTHDPRGEWRLSLVPIPPRINGEGLFAGTWIPVDSIAKSIAGRKRWAIEES